MSHDQTYYEAYGIRAYMTTCCRLAFSTSTPDGVEFLEAQYPDGQWRDTADGSPRYVLMSFRLDCAPIELA